MRLHEFIDTTPISEGPNDPYIFKAVFMAGIAGVAVVVEGLSRAFLDDGKLSQSEINEVFSKVDKKAPAKTKPN